MKCSCVAKSFNCDVDNVRWCWQGYQGEIGGYDVCKVDIRKAEMDCCGAADEAEDACEEDGVFEVERRGLA